MSEDKIKTRWVSHVIRGIGKPRSDSQERYSYRGPVLYAMEWPVARLVKTGGKDWVCVTKTGVQAYAPPDWVEEPTLPTLKCNVTTSCCGVFSPFEGDMCSDEELHGRIKFLSMKEAESIVEKAEVWPIDKILEKSTWRGTGKEQLNRDMLTVAKRYHQYSDAFNLGWPDFPPHYVAMLDRALERRSKEYHNPKAAAQRERNAARKAAKKALGIE